MDPRLTKMQLRVLIALLSFRAKNSDTVWPKRETLAERCGYDVRTISRVTSQLVGLGWLQKEGAGGFSKASSYRVTVPDLHTVTDGETVAEPETVDAGQTVIKPETVAEPETVSDPGTTTVAEPGTKRCPNPSPAKNRPRTDQGTDQSVYCGLDLSRWPSLPSQEVFTDWLSYRRQKRCPVTQSVINLLAGELHKAAHGGYDVDYCLAAQQEAGWQGFKYEWLKNREVQHAQGNRGTFPGAVSRSDRSDEAMREYLASHAGNDCDGLEGAEGMGPRALGYR